MLADLLFKDPSLIGTGMPTPCLPCDQLTQPPPSFVGGPVCPASPPVLNPGMNTLGPEQLCCTETIRLGTAECCCDGCPDHPEWGQPCSGDLPDPICPDTSILGFLDLGLINTGPNCYLGVCYLQRWQYDWSCCACPDGWLPVEQDWCAGGNLCFGCGDLTYELVNDPVAGWECVSPGASPTPTTPQSSTPPSAPTTILTSPESSPAAPSTTGNTPTMLPTSSGVTGVIYNGTSTSTSSNLMITTSTSYLFSSNSTSSAPRSSSTTSTTIQFRVGKNA
ncbi:uncharacterized protein LY89DRAFT_730179 [Mollisia scopiformis]|uniref:Uncharacterized protein n=1 Tax=Mollisia scopiformis TaxID=149040 RepID=A0A194XMB9_MOLSC|nr:uncharacterized protein LY89DRAFT_730179 [Mollisia scopiformis]KUJ21395.1 hypothetical protein LY89DRAFT_730179 [Mollisia scopiformis]